MNMSPLLKIKPSKCVIEEPFLAFSDQFLKEPSFLISLLQVYKSFFLLVFFFEALFVEDGSVVAERRCVRTCEVTVASTSPAAYACRESL